MLHHRTIEQNLFNLSGTDPDDMLETYYSLVFHFSYFIIIF